MKIKTLFVHCLLILGGGFIIFPFVWMMTTSVRAPSEIFEANIFPWPHTFYGFDHYVKAISSVPLLRFMLNGICICSGILVVQLIIAIPAAYALAKLNFRSNKALFITVIAALSIPIQVTALPIYIGLAFLGLLNTYFSIMFPFFISVFAIFLFRQAFKSFPTEIIEAARLDGMSEMEIVWSIVLPNNRPTLVAFSIFSIVAHWNDLYWPMIAVTETKMAPPPLGMMFFATAESGSDYGALMAGAAILTLPLILIFLLARRHFIQGLTISAH